MLYWWKICDEYGSGVLWIKIDDFSIFINLYVKRIILGELSFGGRWAPKLTKGPYNSSNWVEGYEIVTDKYTL